MAYVSHFSDIRLDGEEKTVKQLLAELKAGGGSGVDLGDIETRLAALENPVSISAFSITSPSGALEVGAALTSVGFSWNVSNFAQASSAKIRDVTGSADLSTVTTASGTTTRSVNITKTTPTTHGFRLEVVAGGSTITSTTRNVEWRWASYYGNSASSTLNEAGVKALTKSLRSSTIGNYAISSASGYKVVAVPKSMTQPSGFKDSATGLAVAMQSPVEVTIVNDEGVSVVMNVYVSTNSFSNAITIEAVA